MKKRILFLLGLTGFILTFIGCTKDPISNLTTEESRIYITNHDSTVNFSNYKTYSITDSVVVIDNTSSSHELNDVDQAYIDAVKKYMQQRGYVLADKNNNPDVGVDVSRIIKTTTGVIDNTDYWNYYGGYWDPYYWGYGGYDYYIPYSYSVYQVTEGAMSVDILDLKNASQNNNKIKMIWTGLIRGSGIFDSTSADSQVKALFDQSPYLKTN